VKAEKVREMTGEELVNKERELREQLFKLRLQKATGQLDNVSRLREVRRDIARVATIRRENQR
jgi:large subunit ribosomal protein L29